jgi:hypothetical protein
MKIKTLQRVKSKQSALSYQLILMLLHQIKVLRKRLKKRMVHKYFDRYHLLISRINQILSQSFQPYLIRPNQKKVIIITIKEVGQILKSRLISIERLL